MPNYNYSNLSPYDFELLIRDLLEAAQKIKLRSFAPGRDGGVDLRGWESADPSRSVIVQCKHMEGSTWSNLKSSVTKEKQKIDAMTRKPDRYILATSKPLTDSNIQGLHEILQPYCKSTDDILDVAAIEQMLVDQESVVRSNYKLWISSVAVLDRIMNAGIYTRSDSYRSDLLKKSRTFVQPQALAEARAILKRHHTCIISGLPGVGKTTLAGMLCLEYMAEDFELIVISEDVREADDVYSTSRKQVFMYDDFLGRTDIREKLGKNEDNRLVQFIKRVEHDSNHRFILTTREYILRDARQRYERLDTGDFDVLKCVLQMENYSLLQKGLILYQHLFFAEDIDYQDIENLVRRRAYLDIVRHPNYTPRHLTDALNDIQRRKRVNSPDESGR